MFPTSLIPLCLSSFLSVPFCAPQDAPPKPAPAPAPANTLGEEERAWIQKNARAADAAFLQSTLRTPQALVIESSAQSAASAQLALACVDAARERPNALLLCLPTSFEEGRALDEFVRTGKGDLAKLLESDGLAPLVPAEHGLLAAARGWNADPKRLHELRVAGIEYRRTQSDALGLSDFVTRVEPDSVDRLAQLLGPFRQVGADGRNRYAGCEDTWKQALQQSLNDLEEQSGEKREAWSKAVGAADLERGLGCLARIRQAEAEVSRPKEFRRIRALGENALAARTTLKLKADLVLCTGIAPGMDTRDLRASLGPQSLLVLILCRGDAEEEPAREALVALRPGGALDLRELSKEQREGKGLLARLARRADVVLWDDAR